jgi:predicted transport protein
LAKDVSQKGHWGTGDVEISLTALADLEAAEPYIAAAYEGRCPAGIQEVGAGKLSQPA